MSNYKALIEQYGIPIPNEYFQELRDYTNKRGVKLSGFKDFVGDIQTVKTVVDDICEIAEDFPLILDKRRGVCLELDYNMGTDFATTIAGHVVHLNAPYFGNIGKLEQEYAESVSQGRFVRGTDWRAIARHESGHVVAALYHIDPMEIALEIKDGFLEADILDALTDELSVYSTEFLDGREIISECFSAYYSKVGNEFAERYVSRCKQFAKGRG